ncbi:MAG: hypothetical protein ACRDS0_23425 [Pseudonocardiaceae bacterium]
MSWFLRSMGDHDTHRGALETANGTVAAACGVRFRPLGLPGNRLSLPAYPPDPEQVCPKCRSTR